MKKFIAFVLSLCIAGGAAPAALEYAADYALTASAADIVDSGTCGENLTWTLDGEGTLTISGTGAFEGIEFTDNTYYLSNQVKNIIFESGVTEIGSGSISFSQTESVYLSETVESFSGQVFNYMPITPEIKISEKNPYYKVTDGIVYSIDGRRLICVPTAVTEKEEFVISDTVTEIDPLAMYIIHSENIVIPESIKKINYCALFFSYSSNVASITILSKDCEIYDERNTIAGSGESYGFALWGCIKGYKGSTAEAYSEKYDHLFIPVDDTENKVVKSGECGADGDNLMWTIDSEGTLTISGSGEMDSYHGFDYDVYASPWYHYKNFIRNIVIEDGVTLVTSKAFLLEPYLSSVTIASSITNIEDNAFITGFDNEAGEYITSCEIRGYSGSTAQAYAEKYGYKFVALAANGEILGNVNGDSSLDSSDAAMILQHYAVFQSDGAGKFNGSQLAVADYNNDSNIDSSDAALILRAYAENQSK